VTVVYPRFDQTSVGGFDDLDGLLCVQRRLKFTTLTLLDEAFADLLGLTLRAGALHLLLQ